MPGPGHQQVATAVLSQPSAAANLFIPPHTLQFLQAWYPGPGMKEREPVHVRNCFEFDLHLDAKGATCNHNQLVTSAEENNISVCHPQNASCPPPPATESCIILPLWPYVHAYSISIALGLERKKRTLMKTFCSHTSGSSGKNDSHLDTLRVVLGRFSFIFLVQFFTVPFCS